MMIVVLLSVLLLLGGITVFMARQVYKGIQCVAPTVKLWPFVTVAAVLNASMLVGFMRSLLPLPAVVKAALKVVSAYWMGCFVYVFLFLLAAWIVLMILKLTPLKSYDKRRFVALVAALVLAFGTAGYGFVHAGDIQHVSYTITLDDDKTAPDMTVVMLSDLHLGAVGSESRLEDIAREINALSPDVVCLAGDIFDSDFDAIDNPDCVLKRFRDIRSTYGVYACFGNHDAGSTFSKMTAFLKACGVTLLSDETVTVDGRLTLVGRVDGTPIGGNGGVERKPLEEFLEIGDPSIPVVVLDHNPGNVGAYDGNGDVDLVLSGHTHKGQLFPANFVTDAMYVVDHGYYRHDDSSPQVIVTSGVGTWGMPMRVGSDSEIVTITFA